MIPRRSSCDDVQRLAVGRVIDRRGGEIFRSHLLVHPYRGYARDVPAHRVGRQIADRLPLRGPCRAASSRRSPISGMSKNRARSAPFSSPSARSTASGPVPGRCATASVASDRTLSGSRHFGSPAAISAADDQIQLTVWFRWNAALRGYRPCRTSPRAGSRDRTRQSGSRRAGRPAGTARAGGEAPGSSSTGLCGGIGAGISITRSR